MEDTSKPPVRLGLERGDRVFLFVACSLAGIALGIVLPYVADWLGNLGFVPFGGLLREVGSLDSAWATLGRPLGGLLVGLGVAAYMIHASPVLHLSPNEVKVTELGNTRRIVRSDIAGIFRDGNKLVIESHGGRRLFKGEVEGKKDVVQEAFVSLGYPWETE